MNMFMWCGLKVMAIVTSCADLCVCVCQGLQIDNVKIPHYFEFEIVV